MFGAMIVIQVWLGLYPQPVLTMAGASIEHLQALTAASAIISQR
jgi:NADH:ubiquinone oxidoreductase subunit 4 (subunit M)